MINKDRPHRPDMVAVRSGNIHTHKRTTQHNGDRKVTAISPELLFKNFDFVVLQVNQNFFFQSFFQNGVGHLWLDLLDAECRGGAYEEEARGTGLVH